MVGSPPPKSEGATNSALVSDTAYLAPRLLMATGSLLLTPLDWTLGAIADAGFAGAEVLFAHNPATRDPARVKAFARAAGLEIPVVHGPYMLLLRNVLGADYVEKSRRTLELAAEIGAETVVAHAPFRWELGAREWLAFEADDEAAALGGSAPGERLGGSAPGGRLGPRLAMENLFPLASVAFSSVITPEQLLDFSSVTFDTSHFAVAGVDLFAAWEQLSDRVVHLHVSDNLGNGRDSHAPIGTGTLPLRAFLARVGASGYTGTVTLEVDCRPYVDSRDELVAFLAGQRLIAEELLGGALEPTPTAKQMPTPTPGNEQ